MLFGKKKEKEQRSVLEEEQMQSPFRTIIKNLLENKLAMGGLIVFVSIFAMCFILPIWFHQDLNYQDPTQKNIAPGFSFLSVPSDLKDNAEVIEFGPTYGVGVDKDGSGGRNHLVVVTEDGNAVAWGGNENNQAKVPAKATNIAKLASGYYQNCIIKEDGSVVTWGLKGYLLGTDNLGRNVFYRILKGGQMTMTVGFIAVIIQFAIGILVGGISGYYGGTVDILLMRLAEVVGSLPFIPLALILSALIGNKVSDVGRIIMIMLILGFLGWTGIAGLVRAQVLAERNKEFVVAAKALGVKEKNIIFRHIVPNVMTIIIVQATISFATCMLTESGLSFLGFGVAEPIPSWGNMLNNCRSSEVISQYWWRWVFPSVVLGLCTVSINLFGDGLRRAVDPKANER